MHKSGRDVLTAFVWLFLFSLLSEDDAHAGDGCEGDPEDGDVEGVRGDGLFGLFLFGSGLFHNGFLDNGFLNNRSLCRDFLYGSFDNFLYGSCFLC